MSKQIKQNCERIIQKIQSKLQELRISIKSKKSHNLLQKLISPIINDFKFLQDQFKIISHHLTFLQNKSYEKDIQISSYEKELLNKNAQKKIFEQMMRSKYQKLLKQNKFLQFSGRNGSKQILEHQRCRSELIKKGLNQLQKDIIDSNKKVYNRVKQLKNQIQNQQQRYLNMGPSLPYNIQDINISTIAHDNQHDKYSSPSKINDKKQKVKPDQLDLDDNITAFKTKKKQLLPINNQQSISSFKQKQPNSSQTVVIHKKKKQQLAQLIAQQTKIIVSKEKYFSTDF